MSFFRKCKDCGQTISFRKMPAGQWVAFDPGTDEPHECVKAKAKHKSPTQISRKSPNPSRAISTLDDKDDRLRDWRSQPKLQPRQDWLLYDSLGRTLAAAIESNWKIEILYSGGSTPMTRRVIEPLELFQRGRLHYIRAYCHVRQDNRIFRTDKILAAKPVGGTSGGTPSNLPELTYEREEAISPLQRTKVLKKDYTVSGQKGKWSSFVERFWLPLLLAILYALYKWLK